MARCYRYREVSELSDSDSDTTVQDDDEFVTAPPSDEEPEPELMTVESLNRGHDEGHVKDGKAPWFVQIPSSVSVGLGRTLRCECVVDGVPPIGRCSAEIT